MNSQDASGDLGTGAKMVEGRHEFGVGQPFEEELRGHVLHCFDAVQGL